MLRFLRSRSAFYAVLAFFALESLWIALSSRYPMAFDEYFHYGVAQLHTQTWSPFLTDVPDSASLYGAITRDASFLYHYVLSFPLRLLNTSTDSMVWHILILRILNICIAVASLLIYAKLLRKLGVSQLATTGILLFVSLLPVMPLMAGQISYDNFFFLMVASTLLLGVTFLQRFQTSKQIDAGLLSWLLVSGLFTCFVKYAFLPAMLAIVLLIGMIVVRERRKTIKAYARWWQTASSSAKAALAVALVAGAVLFAGSYGVNLVKYRTPVPDCDAVIGIEACKSYGPWVRDHIAKQTFPGSSFADIPPYAAPWVEKMMEETFFMVGAKYDDGGVIVYRSTKPFPILLAAGWIILVLGIAIGLARTKFIWSRLDCRLIMAVLLLYTLVLFGRNLQFYLETGAAVAIHGRYVLPFMIPAIGILVIAANGLRLPWINKRIVGVLVGVALIAFLQGGLTTFIVATDDDWMWPQSQPAINVNSAARDVLSPLIMR